MTMRPTIGPIGSHLLALGATLAVLSSSCGSSADDASHSASDRIAPSTLPETTVPPETTVTTTVTTTVPPETTVTTTVPPETTVTTTAPPETTVTTTAPETCAVASSTTTQTVKIGFTYPDLAAFAILNKAFGIGDPAQQAEAVLDRWRRECMLPDGLEIDLVFGKYNIISDNAKRGVCTSLAQDEEVFAVVGGRDFTVGAECLATRFDIPVIDTNSAPPSLYQRGAPWFFTLRADQASQLRSFAHWATTEGHLENKTIGLYYETRLDEAVPVLRDDLASFGHEVASEISTSGEGVGAPEDQIAVQRFIAAGVDLVIPIVGGSSSVNVFSFSESQGYRPTYIDLDYGEHTTDVAAKTMPAEQYDGTFAMTMTRAGEVAANGTPTPEAEECLNNYERYSGIEISRERAETGEYSNILLTCDLMSILLAGLTTAAEDLSKESFVTGIETSSDFIFAGSGSGSFGPSDHSGVDEYRTIQWDAECPCWVAVGGWKPIVRD